MTFANWEPILNFTGTFDGDNFTIKNLTVNKSGDKAGFFGNKFDATIKNLTLENANIKATSYVGEAVPNLRYERTQTGIILK